MAEPTNFFEQPVPFLNIPTWVVIIIIAVGFIIYLLLTRKPKEKEYKAIDIRKQTKKDLKGLYNQFGASIQRPLYSGVINIGFVKGFAPILWNKSIPIKDNIKGAKIKQMREFILEEKKKQDETGAPKDLVIMKCLKVCGNSIIKKAFSMLGIGNKFMIVDESLITISDDRWFIDGQAQPIPFFDIIFFTKSGRNFIEDFGAFRINRENELQEIANIVPRVVFFDNMLAKSVAKLREVAEIEKERYRGQKESAEE